MIRNINPIFSQVDIYQLENLRIYDNIFLSNLACYNQNMNSYNESVAFMVIFIN